MIRLRVEATELQKKSPDILHSACLVLFWTLINSQTKTWSVSALNDHGEMLHRFGKNIKKYRVSNIYFVTCRNCWLRSYQIMPSIIMKHSVRPWIRPLLMREVWITSSPTWANSKERYRISCSEFGPQFSRRFRRKQGHAKKNCRGVIILQLHSNSQKLSWFKHPVACFSKFSSNIWVSGSLITHCLLSNKSAGMISLSKKRALIRFRSSKQCIRPRSVQTDRSDP